MSLRACFLLLVLQVAALPASGADQRFPAFGDSINAGDGDTDVVCPDNTVFGGYLQRLRSQLAAQGIDAETSNFGLCGERTTSGVTRIESVLAQDGDVIVIMEGTNDSSRGEGA